MPRAKSFEINHDLLTVKQVTDSDPTPTFMAGLTLAFKARNQLQRITVILFGGRILQLSRGSSGYWIREAISVAEPWSDSWRVVKSKGTEEACAMLVRIVEGENG